MAKRWVGAEVYGLILQDVHGFNSFDEAKEWFKKYTGVDYNEYIKKLEDDPSENILPEIHDQSKIFEVDIAFKSAKVEVCYKGGDIVFRCPECDSLNINDTEPANKCPDCGAEFAVPQITECDCKGKNQE